jgi:hypothetical protein
MLFEPDFLLTFLKFLLVQADFVLNFGNFAELSFLIGSNASIWKHSGYLLGSFLIEFVQNIYFHLLDVLEVH